MSTDEGATDLTIFIHLEPQINKDGHSFIAVRSGRNRRQKMNESLFHELIRKQILHIMIHCRLEASLSSVLILSSMSLIFGNAFMLTHMVGQYQYFLSHVRCAFPLLFVRFYF